MVLFLQLDKNGGSATELRKTLAVMLRDFHALKESDPIDFFYITVLITDSFYRQNFPVMEMLRAVDHLYFANTAQNQSQSFVYLLG